MKSFTITAPKVIEYIAKDSIPTPENYAKVRVTKAGIHGAAINLYKGIKSHSYPIVPSKQGAGVISEIAEDNEKGLKKGDKVFINPYLPCKECFQCKSGNTNICTDMKIMGYNTDGFLLDFVNVPIDNLIKLPEQVSDSEVLFADNISMGLEVLDSLHVDKGDHIAIVGGNVLGNILAQLIMYLQAVPILIDENDKNIKKAKDSGIYYIVSKDDDAHKIINQITGGRLAKYVIYVAGSEYDLQQTTELCSEGGTICLCNYGIQEYDLKINLKNLVKRNLKILTFNNGSYQLQAALNILATKSITVSNLITDTIKMEKVPETFKTYSDILENNTLFEVIVDTL